MAVRVPRRVVILLCALSCAWAVLIVAAPLTARAGATGARLSAAAYLVGGLICHQHAERSFHLAGAQLPVCGRCTGLYLSGAIGMLAGLAARARRSGPRPRVSRRAILIAALFPVAASVALEAAGLWAATTWWRALSVLPAGWAAGEVIVESSSFQGRL